MLGVLLILASTFAYNGSSVLLAAAARERSGGSSPILAVSRRAPGLLGLLLNFLGWVLEIAALALISLTLARVLNVAGLGLLLVLARWVLKEPLGRRELSGVGLIVLGTVAVSFAPPSFGSLTPAPEGWALLLVVLMPGVVLPYVLRALQRPVSAILGAVAAGLAYALSGILNKGAVEAVYSGSILPLVLFTAGLVVIGLLGFDTELGALRDGYVSVVVPIVLALHTAVPIVCAPFLFDEAWPVGSLPRAFLGGGILFALLGTLLLASSSSHVLVKR